MRKKEKGPFEEIEELQRRFGREVPGLDYIGLKKPERVKTIPLLIKPITLIFIIVVISFLIYYVIYTPVSQMNFFKRVGDFIGKQVVEEYEKKKEEIKKEEKKDESEKEKNLGFGKAKPEKPETICIVKVPFDSDVANVSAKKGIKEAKIEFITKKERKILFYIGDFVSAHDAVFVSARLNDKGVQHTVKNIDGKWRVYIFIESPSLEFYKKKESITRKDQSDIEKLVSSKVGEVVKAEIVEDETISNISTFIFSSQKDCEDFFSTLMRAGKKAEKEIKINI
ncbi:MAG: hypothetical protein RRA63_09485 [Candidatus Calescibacterium sp.]|jgi:hypothetical protein|nr:hypothetical protein [Candidatus Calescibacterium sp.]